ncbi:hypothetical protein BPOR_0640g00020 [Botrytis porri]|uniref:Uncharacterized protein n=1 Tax=Botrytis porri TaxID=87229 RepID=A0A4Z1KBD8_9HELO|nr:hypothetical protein BPOR_0640g00020 [Botrytis porri]
MLRRITTNIQQLVLATATTQSTPSASTTITTSQTTQASNGKKVVASDQAYLDVIYAVQEGFYAALDPILAQIVKNSANMALKDFKFQISI